jgi:hypothetical protein
MSKQKNSLNAKLSPKQNKASNTKRTDPGTKNSSDPKGAPMDIGTRFLIGGFISVLAHAAYMQMKDQTDQKERNRNEAKRKPARPKA